MPEPWTGDLVGRMHNNDVTASDLAAEMGCTKAYVSMLLHSVKNPKDAQEKLEAAFAAILARRSPDSSKSTA